MFEYAITLTLRDGFTPDHFTAVRHYFDLTCESCLVVAEDHASGGIHFHAATSQRQKTTNEVTRLLHRYYSKQGWEVTPRSVQVKRMADRVGWFHYLTKDLTGPPVLVRGWRMTWIQQQCMDNLKKMPRRLLRKDTFVVTHAEGPRLVIEYAKRTGCVLSGKDSFIDVCCQMSRNGYQFHQIRWKQLYTHTMSMCGDMTPMQSFIVGELTFLS